MALPCNQLLAASLSLGVPQTYLRMQNAAVAVASDAGIVASIHTRNNISIRRSIKALAEADDLIAEVSESMALAQFCSSDRYPGCIDGSYFAMEVASVLAIMDCDTTVLGFPKAGNVPTQDASTPTTPPSNNTAAHLREEPSLLLRLSDPRSTNFTKPRKKKSRKKVSAASKQALNVAAKRVKLQSLAVISKRQPSQAAQVDIANRRMSCAKPTVSLCAQLGLATARSRPREIVCSGSNPSWTRFSR